ncbi:hypothetical protein CHUAL_011907 [Chamberlinius hualienensis]
MEFNRLRRIIHSFILTVVMMSFVWNSAMCYDWMDTKECIVELINDGPAYSYAPIGFSARVKDLQHNYTSLNYRWESLNGTFKETMFNQSTECNITTSVDTVGEYKMKVLVENSDGIKLCRASTPYIITDRILGRLEVFQNGTDSKRSGLIAANTLTNVSFTVHDPYNYFNGSFSYYSWGMGDLTFPPISYFLHNFTSAKHYHLILVVSILVQPENEKPRAYFGSYSMNLEAKDPIKISNVTGETSIQHGDLLDMEISCEGSTPLNYCWYFTQLTVNTSTVVCEEPYATSYCNFVVVRYFKKSGNYKLVLIIDNEIDHKVFMYNINVFQRGAEPQLSPIIVPLACSCVALVIVVIGIMYFIHSRRNYIIEVADFDFQQSDSFESQSFTDRMVEACKTWFGYRYNKPEKSSVYRRIPAQIT